MDNSMDLSKNKEKNVEPFCGLEIAGYVEKGNIINILTRYVHSHAC